MERPAPEVIERVERHLCVFSDPLDPPEQMMLDRLKSGHWTVFDQRFCEHGLLEADMMETGTPYEEAHPRVLAMQGISYQRGYEAYLYHYHPDVIRHPDAAPWFSRAARDLSAQLADEEDR